MRIRRGISVELASKRKFKVKVSRILRGLGSSEDWQALGEGQWK